VLLGTFVQPAYDDATPSRAEVVNRKGAPMPLCLRLLAALTVVLALTAGCSAGGLPGTDGSSSASGGKTSGTLAEGTCWDPTLLGADPQHVLKLSGTYDVPYLVAARALAARPSFDHELSCAEDHAVEVYKVLRLPDLDPQLTDYATLLRIQTPLYDEVARSVAAGCQTDVLAKGAAASGLPGAVMAPVLPEGATLGWAPAPPDLWGKGTHVFACTLTWAHPEKIRYDSVFTKGFPTAKRTCIDSQALAFVDCARNHDRERIAVIEARDAVVAGAFPGPKAIRSGPHGRYLAVSDGQYRPLDAACTSYLRAVSTAKKLTGVANVDVDEWPAPGDSYPIYCEADAPPDKKSVVTKGSVYDRG
jgi:hypothetical protein